MTCCFMAVLTCARDVCVDVKCPFAVKGSSLHPPPLVIPSAICNHIGEGAYHKRGCGYIIMGR